VNSVAGRRLRLVVVSSCFLLALVALVVFALAGRSASAAGVSVEAGNNYFCSQAFDGSVCETDITAGDAITWSVETGTHRVVQCTDSSFTACPPAGGFDGGNFSTGQTFSHTFATAGTYFYHCSIHPTEMMGKVVVSSGRQSAISGHAISEDATGGPARPPVP
jgi:plastocyanin